MESTTDATTTDATTTAATTTDATTTDATTTAATTTAATTTAATTTAATTTAATTTAAINTAAITTDSTTTNHTVDVHGYRWSVALLSNGTVQCVHDDNELNHTFIESIRGNDTFRRVRDGEAIQLNRTVVLNGRRYLSTLLAHDTVRVINDDDDNM